MKLENASLYNRLAKIQYTNYLVVVLAVSYND
jgi:hypothetical protein